MVNMNAADDKEKNCKIAKLNGRSEEASGTSSLLTQYASSSSSYTQNNENKKPLAKQNGNIVQSKDFHPITNGAYPKVKQASNNSNALENNGPSCSRRSSSEKSSVKLENLVDPYSHVKDADSAIRNNDYCPIVDPATQKQCKPRVCCDYGGNSSSEDEECCIYTYKGDSNQMADLPSSFFNLDLLPARPSTNSRNSSPDMDYLEMDFDPGPSNDRYSSTDSECDERLENEDGYVPDLPLLPKPLEGCESLPEPQQQEASQSTPNSPLSTPSPRPHSSADLSPLSVPISSPPDPGVVDTSITTVQPIYCYCGANKLSPLSIDENFNDGDAGTMIWKEQEAKEKQVNQIGVSLCGATAVVNALLGLNIQFSVCAVKQIIATRFRAETALIPEYLLSRCYSGVTHEDMIRAIHGASQQMVYARFFHTHPKRNISLTSWLSYWLRKGVVPILTLNLQKSIRPGGEIPDFWHHQMVYGVSSKGIHLTNPLEVQQESHLWPQLASPSVMLVRREDVTLRWTSDTNLLPLVDPTRPDWRRMNVLGQVVNVIREHDRRSQPTSHITIPASYSPGVTLCVLRSSPAYDELRLAPELPIDPLELLDPQANS